MLFNAIDHVALVVRDLDAATRAYTALLGCEPNWRGADGGAEHTWFQLPNMALDIIAATGPGYTGDRVSQRLASHGEGIWAVALATPDIAQTHRKLARRAVPATDPRPIRSTHVSTREKRYWTTSVIAPEASGGVTLFMVEQSPTANAWPRSSATVAEDSTVTALDHLVIRTSHPERAVAFYGARLGLELTLDRTHPDWKARLLFFRCGDSIIEVAHALDRADVSAPDLAWGLSWRVTNIVAVRDRLQTAGFDVSEVRTGRKPGTQVCTVRNAGAGIPTILVGPDASSTS